MKIVYFQLLRMYLPDSVKVVSELNFIACQQLRALCYKPVAEFFWVYGNFPTANGCLLVFRPRILLMMLHLVIGDEGGRRRLRRHRGLGGP